MSEYKIGQEEFIQRGAVSHYSGFNIIVKAPVGMAFSGMETMTACIAREKMPELFWQKTDEQKSQRSGRAGTVLLQRPENPLPGWIHLARSTHTSFSKATADSLWGHLQHGSLMMAVLVG